MADNGIKVVLVNTSDIKPYHRNARKNDETVLKLCEIIPKVGFNVPVVIDKNNVIIKGHSRWKAAVKLGMKQIPCIISENDDETNKLDRLADNKIQEFSKWDDEILATELMSVNIPDIELSDFGFDDFMAEIGSPEQTPQYTPYAAPSGEVPHYAGADMGEHETPYYPKFTPPAYTPPTGEESKDFITEKDIAKTVATSKSEYGCVTCPKCGTVVMYKK